VFVTVEPNGESHKPSGKSLLFAYLKVNPNHPIAAPTFVGDGLPRGPPPARFELANLRFNRP